MCSSDLPLAAGLHRGVRRHRRGLARPLLLPELLALRSEERRVGKECRIGCRSRCSRCRWAGADAAVAGRASAVRRHGGDGACGEREERRSRGKRGRDVWQLSGTCAQHAGSGARPLFFPHARLLFPHAALYHARWSARNGPARAKSTVFAARGTYPAPVGDALRGVVMVLVLSRLEHRGKP